jgi:hypothetical protein
MPIIGRLSGAPKRQPPRYAHLDNDPLRQASDAIAGRIAALEGNKFETEHNAQ